MRPGADSLVRDMKDVFHELLNEKCEHQETLKDELAAVVSMSSNEFYDLKAYPDEWRMVVPIYKIRVILKLLKIDVRRFLNPTGAVDFSRFHSCAEYIKDRRQQLGLSPSQFATRPVIMMFFATLLKQIVRASYFICLRRPRRWRRRFRYQWMISWSGF
jgi:hypothetical protein